MGFQNTQKCLNLEALLRGVKTPRCEETYPLGTLTQAGLMPLTVWDPEAWREVWSEAPPSPGPGGGDNAGV